MRRAATWVPYGDYWVPMFEGRIPVAKDWRDIAGRSYTAAEFLADLRPERDTTMAIADAMERWAMEEGNHHPGTFYVHLAAQLQNDAADALAECEE